MCPGGYVVNASSEQGLLAVNGMSYHARDSRNANSAIVVTVGLQIFPAAMRREPPPFWMALAFQRRLEREAFLCGGGAIPVQRFEDFCRNRPGGPGSYEPCMKGRYEYANVRSIFPEFLAVSLNRALQL